MAQNSRPISFVDTDQADVLLDSIALIVAQGIDGNGVHDRAAIDAAVKACLLQLINGWDR